MTHLRFCGPALILVILGLAVVMGSAPAHAAPTGEDRRPTPSHTAQAHPADFPAAIDSDVFAYAVAPPSERIL